MLFWFDSTKCVRANNEKHRQIAATSNTIKRPALNAQTNVLFFRCYCVYFEEITEAQTTCCLYYYAVDLKAPNQIVWLRVHRTHIHQHQTNITTPACHPLEQRPSYTAHNSTYDKFSTCVCVLYSPHMCVRLTHHTSCVCPETSANQQVEQCVPKCVWFAICFCVFISLPI